MSLRQKAAGAAAAAQDADADGRAEAPARWPAVYTAMHAVAPFELVRPHAVPAHVFDAGWARGDTTARYCYTFAAHDGDAWTRAKEALLARAPARLHVHEVARREWARGTHFHAAYSFASWFDDVFAMHLFGACAGSPARVRVELRCSRSSALRGFSAVTLQQALFADDVFADTEVIPCDDDDSDDVVYDSGCSR